VPSSDPHPINPIAANAIIESITNFFITILLHIKSFLLNFRINLHYRFIILFILSESRKFIRKKFSLCIKLMLNIFYIN
ncbi:MAG TPA: hypothetical protein PLY36_00005, partial [Spirochaetota bacterium]|nr:hypothetical protein [Spirochaetota bacterium]